MRNVCENGEVRNLASRTSGWMLGNNTDVPRYGVWVLGWTIFYTNIAPLGLKIGGYCRFLHKYRPAGAEEKMATVVFYTYTHQWKTKIRYGNNECSLIRVIRIIRINPRFRRVNIAPLGNQSSVCSSAIYRTSSASERRTHRVCLLPCITSMKQPAETPKQNARSHKEVINDQFSGRQVRGSYPCFTCHIPTAERVA